MEGLLEDVETTEALQHVLAFLDACDSQDDTSESSDQLRSSDDAEEPAKLSEQRKRTQRLATKTRYRGRVKEEHSRLREDVTALEATLAQLKGINSSPQAVDESAVTEWRDGSSASHEVTRETVAREFKRRRQSENVNRELKDLLVKVRKASSKTATAWDKLLTKKNLAFLNEPPPQSQPMQNAIQPNQLPGLYHTLASLPMRMDRLAMDTDWHFARVGLNDSNSFTYRTQRVLDQTFDQAFEIVMSSSLPCTKEHAAAMIVRYFYGNGKHKNGRYPCTEGLTETIRKTSKSVRFGSQQFSMEGIATNRKLIEDDRNRFLWSTLSYLPEAASSFREDCIMALQPISASASPMCLLQIWYCVYAEPFTTSNPWIQASQESKQLKESVLRSHCRTTGDFFQSVEKMLANEAYNPRA